MPRLTVVGERSTGLNEKIRDNKTGEVLTRKQVAKRIREGIYPNYIEYKDDKNRTIIRSKPDGKKGNNLG